MCLAAYMLVARAHKGVVGLRASERIAGRAHACYSPCVPAALAPRCRAPSASPYPCGCCDACLLALRWPVVTLLAMARCHCEPAESLALRLSVR
jgi:hypothetical protein